MTAPSWESPFEDHDLDFDTLVYRAVNPRFVNWEDLDGRGFPKMATSQIFQHMSEAQAKAYNYEASAMSVALSNLLEENGERPERVLDGNKSDWGIAAFSVGALRDVRPRLGVCEDPITDAPWHGLVFAKTRPKMKRPESQGLLAIATLVRSPIAI